jgi:hypothetical protein
LQRAQQKEKEEPDQQLAREVICCADALDEPKFNPVSSVELISSHVYEKYYNIIACHDKQILIILIYMSIDSAPFRPKVAKHGSSTGHKPARGADDLFARVKRDELWS